eukprot:5385607-Amphidinium_carterae.1
MKQKHRSNNDHSIDQNNHQTNKQGNRKRRHKLSLECAGLAGRWARMHAAPVALEQCSCGCR